MAVQLGTTILDLTPDQFTDTPFKVGERKARSINGTSIKSGTPILKHKFSLSGLTKTNYNQILSQFALFGFLNFIPGSDLFPDVPGASFTVSFDGLSSEKEGGSEDRYSIELEER